MIPNQNCFSFLEYEIEDVKNLNLMRESIESAQVEILSSLLEKGLDFNFPRLERSVRRAMNQRHFQVLKMLIEHKLKKDKRNCKKMCFELICEMGDQILFDAFIEENEIKEIYKSLYHCCKGGNLSIVKKMLEMGARDLQRGYLGACKSNNALEIVKLLIENNGDCWNWNMQYACETGDLELVKMIESNIRKSFQIFGLDKDKILEEEEMKEAGKEKDKIYWNRALFGACSSANLEMVKYIISKGANSWKGSIKYACKGENHFFFFQHKSHYKKNQKGGNLKILQILIDNCDENELGFSYSCKYGQMDLLKFFQERGSNNVKIGLAESAKSGNLEMVKLFIKEGAENINSAFYNSAKKGNRKVLDHLLSQSESHLDLNDVSYYLLKHEYLDLLSKTNLAGKLDNGHFFGACESGNINLVRKTLFTSQQGILNHGLSISLERGYIDLSFYLIERCASVDIVNENQIPFIEFVFHHDFEDLLQTFLSCKSLFYKSLPYLCKEEKNFSLVESIIENNPFTNFLDDGKNFYFFIFFLFFFFFIFFSSGGKCIIESCLNENFRITLLLLHYGANPDLKNKCVTIFFNFSILFSILLLFLFFFIIQKKKEY